MDLKRFWKQLTSSTALRLATIAGSGLAATGCYDDPVNLPGPVIVEEPVPGEPKQMNPLGDVRVAYPDLYSRASEYQRIKGLEFPDAAQFWGPSTTDPRQLNTEPFFIAYNQCLGKTEAECANMPGVKAIAAKATRNLVDSVWRELVPSQSQKSAPLAVVNFFEIEPIKVVRYIRDMVEQSRGTEGGASKVAFTLKLKPNANELELLSYFFAANGTPEAEKDKFVTDKWRPHTWIRLISDLRLTGPISQTRDLAGLYPTTYDMPADQTYRTLTDWMVILEAQRPETGTGEEYLKARYNLVREAITQTFLTVPSTISVQEQNAAVLAAVTAFFTTGVSDPLSPGLVRVAVKEGPNGAYQELDAAYAARVSVVFDQARQLLPTFIPGGIVKTGEDTRIAWDKALDAVLVRPDTTPEKAGLINFVRNARQEAWPVNNWIACSINPEQSGACVISGAPDFMKRFVDTDVGRRSVDWGLYNAYVQSAVPSALLRIVPQLSLEPEAQAQGGVVRAGYVTAMPVLR